MNEQDLALNNPQSLVCHKTQPRQLNIFCYKFSGCPCNKLIQETNVQWLFSLDAGSCHNIFLCPACEKFIINLKNLIYCVFKNS